MTEQAAIAVQDVLRKTVPCACCGRRRWIQADPLARPGYHIRFRGPKRCRCKGP